jgi:predicted ATPase
VKLTIKNIGVIKEADIELSGLTVIAGENDSGKSASIWSTKGLPSILNLIAA